jgi:hypothetical protein
MHNIFKVQMMSRVQEHMMDMGGKILVKFNVFTRYCYFFENLLTGIREFKALKSLEFTRFSPILCYPSLSLKYKQKIIDEHS